MLPQSLIESLRGKEGFDANAFMSVHASGEQIVSVRLNPAKPATLEADWHMSEIPWCRHGRYLSQRPSFTMDPLLHAGAYYVQEASSMFLWHALTQTVGGSAGKKVLDLCAAPGGKSSLLASYFADGLVVANEVIRQRVNILAENLTKWGSSHTVVTNNDPAHFRAVPDFFDVMVVDAPCSGSGLFRKDPDAILEWSENNVALCSQRQQRILADAIPSLVEGGVLIYSTCSYSHEEDETIADWLVEEMGMESCRIDIPAIWAIVETASPKKNAFGYRFYPHLVKGEGFYIAAFRKTTSISTEAHSKWQPLMASSRAEKQMVSDTFPVPDEMLLFRSGEMIHAIHRQWQDAMALLSGNLYLRKAGTAIGTIKGKDLIPAHELALSDLSLANVPSLSLDKEQALRYLKRQDLFVDGQKGWSLVRYCGLSLGWVKVLPNRINNYYPPEWRILKD